MYKSRLIIDFKSQNRRSIWKHLDALAENYAVYSRHLEGYPPFLSEKDIYLYVYDRNVVFVCLDLCPKNTDRVYEESDTIQPMLYEGLGAPRVSMVWYMSEAIKMMNERLKAANIEADVYGVLLSESEITNSDDLEDMWASNHIMVIDGFSRLKYRSVKVNDDDDLPGKAVTDALLNEPPRDKVIKKLVTTHDDDEFEKLLDEYLKCVAESEDDDDEPFDDPDSSDNSDSSDDSDFSDDSDLSDDDDDDDDDDDPNDSPVTVHWGDDTQFPSGIIEQNNNVIVKVEILRPIANPREELDKLVGCGDIKKRMDELVALTSYNKMMREMFPLSKQHDVSLHSVFLGRPGTGKTTVCKIFGSLLREAGALSKGHVVVCDRGTFIGTLWGDEERSVRQVIEMAQGGVLMVDEAYLLNGKNENDPGKIVIQMMMSILADEKQRDIAIVLCGYKEPMEKMLETNPGLQSRFPNKFEFADFTVDELLEITRRRVREYEYDFTQSAWDKYRQILTQAYQQRNPQTWGNARFVANQLERIYILHASRCVKERPADRQQLRLMTSEDILPIEVPKEKRRIGF